MKLETRVVGRETELAQLHRWLDKSLAGERQIVFVTGEPGIGKTTVVDAFLARLADEHEHEHELWIGRGQCIEHYGSGEAYLPVLAALGRLCREPEGERLIEVLTQHAPTWLVQMPALLSGAELDALQRKTAGATRERMLRELTEAVGALTAERPLVLWVEDLQWSDVSTLDWLAFVARRQEYARLLVIGTFRPVEVIVSAHPLKAVKQELQLHGQCEEMALGLLTEAQVAEYLVRRFRIVPSPLVGEACPEPSRRGQDGGVSRQQHSRRPPHPSPLPRGEREPIAAASLHKLARAIHRRTDGNPLFMVNVIDQLTARGVFVQAGGQWTVQKDEDAVGAVPESLRQMIEQQVERLSVEERRMLEAASVAGVEFSAAAVAAGVGTEPDAIEDQCTRLARREQFLRLAGTNEWPDGTVAERYGFLHALYQEVVYERVTAGRRVMLHQRIGEREEQAYGDRAREIAAELAVHFERGRAYRKAIQYLQQASENVIRRSANQEAIGLLTRALELLETLPDTPERIQQELTLQIALGPLLGMTKGFAAPEVEKAYARARELCQQVEETPQLFWILFGLCGFYVLRAKHQTARGLAEQLLSLAQRLHDPALLVRAHHILGLTLFWLGKLAPALEHLEQGIAPCDPQQRHAYHAGPDPRVVGPAHAAFILWLLGYPDQALKRSREALTVAQELSHPFSLAVALNTAAVLHRVRREVQAVRARAEAAMALSTEQGFAVLLAQGTTLRGWALVEQGQREEGITQVCQGLTTFQATGTELSRPTYLSLLAEAHGKVGQAEEGLSVLAKVLETVSKTEERYYEAELYRLKGTLTLQSQASLRQVKTGQDKSENTNPQSLIPNPQAEAEAYFHKAIEIARQQQAKSLELRATMSLARLWQSQGKKKQARKMLAEIYIWFTEGFDTKDLQEAKTLLDELA